MRFRTRTDANQKEIDKALRGVGASVLPLSNVGAGCPDRLVGYRGVNYLLEIKNRDGFAARKSEGRTPAQVEFLMKWTGQVSTVFDVDEALKAIGALCD